MKPQQYPDNKPHPFLYGAPPPQQPIQPMDVEAQQAANYAAAFIDKKIRTAFVRKVFALVLLQLAVTIGVAAVFLLVKPVNEYIAGVEVCNANNQCYRETPKGVWVFYTAWALTFVMLLVLTCSTSIRRKYPWNYLAMAFFTIVMSVLVGSVCAYWGLAVVLEAVAITGAAVVGLTLAAFFIPWDLTKYGNVLGMAGMILFFMAFMTFIVAFFYVSKWWYLLISCLFALLFAAYLVYDIQALIGGKSHEISPDEYIFASVQIYVDIILLFLQILNIVGIASS
jgi:FtsH-binding integral membrane protein